LEFIGIHSDIVDCGLPRLRCQPQLVAGRLQAPDFFLAVKLEGCLGQLGL
jgi:hypothetical protein